MIEEPFTIIGLHVCGEMYSTTRLESKRKNARAHPDPHYWLPSLRLYASSVSSELDVTQGETRILSDT